MDFKGLTLDYGQITGDIDLKKAILTLYKHGTIDNITTAYNRKNTKYVGLLSYTGKNPYTGVSGYYNDVMLRKWYETPVSLVFEDTKFMTISGYKEDLLHRYGPHYAEPYPEEKRVTKHDVKSYEIEPWVLERIK